VDDIRPVRGDLQAELMAALWRLGAGTVADVRGELPDRYRGGYTTVQTVLNRLAGRGLLSRAREGNAIVYRPALTEAEYLVRSIQRALAGASSAAREVALAELVRDLAADDDAADPSLGRGPGRT
jgi:predicted transcriptional regulator